MKHVDWFNVMSYDLHGVWDAHVKDEGAFARAHTNLTAIEERLSMFWKNDITVDKLVIGLAGYARTYKLAGGCSGSAF